MTAPEADVNVSQLNWNEGLTCDRVSSKNVTLYDAPSTLTV